MSDDGVEREPQPRRNRFRSRRERAVVDANTSAHDRARDGREPLPVHERRDGVGRDGELSEIRRDVGEFDARRGDKRDVAEVPRRERFSETKRGNRVQRASGFAEKAAARERETRRLHDANAIVVPSVDEIHGSVARILGERAGRAREKIAAGEPFDGSVPARDGGEEHDGVEIGRDARRLDAATETETAAFGRGAAVRRHPRRRRRAAKTFPKPVRFKNRRRVGGERRRSTGVRGVVHADDLVQTRAPFHHSAREVTDGRARVAELQLRLRGGVAVTRRFRERNRLGEPLARFGERLVSRRESSRVREGDDVRRPRGERATKTRLSRVTLRGRLRVLRRSRALNRAGQNFNRERVRLRRVHRVEV